MIEAGAVDWDGAVKVITVVANLVAIPAVKGIWVLIKEIQNVKQTQAIMLQALIDKGIIRPFGELMSDPYKIPETKATEKES